jgi:hypothetical protein
MCPTRTAQHEFALFDSFTTGPKTDFPCLALVSTRSSLLCDLYIMHFILQNHVHAIIRLISSLFLTRVDSICPMDPAGSHQFALPDPFTTGKKGLPCLPFVSTRSAV